MTAWCVALMPNAHTGFRSDRIFPIVCLSKNILEQNLNLKFKFQHMCKAGPKALQKREVHLKTLLILQISNVNITKAAFHIELALLRL